MARPSGEYGVFKRRCRYHPVFRAAYIQAALHYVAFGIFERETLYTPRHIFLSPCPPRQAQGQATAMTNM